MYINKHEVVTAGAQDELMQSQDCKLKTSNTSYVTARRDVQCFPILLSFFSPTTSWVCRIPLTSGAPSGVLLVATTPPARRRPTGLPCWRDPWSASSAARRCCFRARPPVRPWWPGPPPLLGAQLPAPGSGVVAGGCRVHRQVSHLSVWSQSKGQLSCCDVRAVSHLSVVQDLRDVARDRSFKHVFLGVVVMMGCY